MRTIRDGRPVVWVSVIPLRLDNRRDPVEIAWAEDDCEPPQVLLLEPEHRGWLSDSRYELNFAHYIGRWRHLAPERIHTKELPARLREAWTGKTLVARIPRHEMTWLGRAYSHAAPGLIAHPSNEVVPWRFLTAHNVIMDIGRQINGQDFSPRVVMSALEHFVPGGETGALAAFLMALWARGAVDADWSRTVVEAATARNWVNPSWRWRS